MTETFQIVQVAIMTLHCLSTREIMIWFKPCGTTSIHRFLQNIQTRDPIELPYEVVKRVQLQKTYIQLFWRDGNVAEYEDHKLANWVNLKVKIKV